MLEFTSEEYGKTISEELSLHLLTYTTKNDYANINQLTGISISTIRDVTRRYNTLTESNSVAIKELYKIAVENCNNRAIENQKAKDFFYSLSNN